jgi:predicted CopG family antitoxin
VVRSRVLSSFQKENIYHHTQTHTELATKNIAISEEAYQRLKALKKPGESFTDVIERMTRTRGVLDLVGVISVSEAKEASARIRESREQSSRRLRHTIEKLS